MYGLAITDKYGSAIDSLTRQAVAQLPHLNIRVLPIHPKRPDADSLAIFQREAAKADFIWWAYWKTADMLRERFPETKKVPSFLEHHNPYNLKEKDWTGYTKVVVKNNTMKAVLPLATVIEHTVPTDQFPWNRPTTPSDIPRIGMVAARIEGKKGILPVATACAALGYKFILVGRVSDERYFQDIRNVFGEKGNLFEFYNDVDHDGLLVAYQSMDLLVVNSVDNFESGPLPALEAMSVGVPVACREGIGYFPDIDQDAYFHLTNAPDDVAAVQQSLADIMADETKRQAVRDAAWHVVKYRDSRYSARKTEGLIYDVLYGQPLVSVIVPTFNRWDAVDGLLARLDEQTYRSLEIVVCNDNGDLPSGWLQSARQKTKHAIKYLNTRDEGYGLAKARNKGALMAAGEYFLFLDDRHLPSTTAVQEFVDQYRPKTWLYGKKDNVSKEFVENFSFIHRQDFFDMGLFCERIREYGGMSQEIRVRARHFGLTLKEADIHAETVVKTKSRHTRKDEIIRTKHTLWLMGK